MIAFLQIRTIGYTRVFALLFSRRSGAVGLSDASLNIFDM